MPKPLDIWDKRRLWNCWNETFIGPGCDSSSTSTSTPAKLVHEIRSHAVPPLGISTLSGLHLKTSHGQRVHLGGVSSVNELLLARSLGVGGSTCHESRRRAEARSRGDGMSRSLGLLGLRDGYFTGILLP